MELGPLLQRPRPGRRRARSWPGTSSSCPSTTRTRPARCPTRSPTPRSSTTSSSRPSTAGPCGHLRRRLPRDLDRAELASVYEQARAAGRTSGSTARRAPGAAAAALPARQRQRLGQRHHLRPRTRRRRPPTSPRSSSCSCANSPTWPRELGPRRRRGRVDAGRRPDARGACSTSCGRATGSPPAAPASGDTWTQLAACSTSCPSCSATDLPADIARRAGRRHRGPPDRRTAWPPSCPPRRTTSPTATGAARSGRPSTVLIEDGLRRAGYAELADEISARFRALCEKSGFAENFDAHTGAGLRDRAYTWTASGYLILAAAQEERRVTAG